MYYRGSQAALVVYDIMNADSFRRAKAWVKELRQSNPNNMVIGLAGNKSDKAAMGNRQVDTREATEYAEENGLIFMETSAKRGDNVTEIFMAIAKQVASTQLGLLTPAHTPFPPKKPAKEGGCCGGESKS